MKNAVSMMAMVIALALGMAGVAHAKFQCAVESVEGDRMILKNCDQDKSAKIKPGDTINITKARPVKLDPSGQSHDLPVKNQ